MLTSEEVGSEMETISISDNAAIRVLTMDRPEVLNAVNLVMADELADAFTAAAADDAVKVLVLTGAGRAFSAGADISEMGAPQDPKQRRQSDMDGMVGAMIDFPKPFIAAVNGVGAGYGATVCGLADLVVMSTSARLRCPFSALGLPPELASTYTFSRLMGPQRAAWFLLAGQWMTAAECVEAGLALEAVEPEALMPRVLERAAVLASLPMASLTTNKRLLVEPHRGAMHEAMWREIRALENLGGGPANREAIAAFREKRDPDFSDM
jgi:enoyl-CoA hydratase/carnithine racemase